MSESEAKTITITSTMEPKPDVEHGRDMQAEILAQQELDKITIRLRPVDPGGISPTDHQAKSKSNRRTREPWAPTARELAIVNIPRTIKPEEYCKRLDRAGIPFPEEWGSYQSHEAAYHAQGMDEKKRKRLRGWMNSNRSNVWKRFLKN
jgi:hypothetical protein